ncbi:MAG TPA: hypothetical protein VMU16_14740 [Candidatus Binataceae bacterium]|nr:hypothetical protein [Candidatus Binataceae bacterium]
MRETDGDREEPAAGSMPLDFWIGGIPMGARVHFWPAFFPPAT